MVAKSDMPTRIPPQGLRIAMVTTFYPPCNFGGDGAYVRRLAHSLVRRGHEVEVIIDADAYESLTGKSGLEPLPEPEGLKVHFVRSGWGKLSVLATQQLGRPVFNGRKFDEILGNRFDVVHFHNISLVGGPGVLGYGGDAVKLYTTHEHWLVCQSHILWRHKRELCDRRECVRCALAHGRPPQLWRATPLLERMCREVDAFISLSQSCVDNHRRFGFNFPMRVMPSFLPDNDTVDETPATAGPERPYYLFVGRLSRIKGLQDVIPLFDSESPADLLIAGTGEDEAELRALAEGRASVKFLGHCGGDELTRLYRQAVAVVVPSRCYEVAPLVVLEAFRESTPVIARNLGPFPEFIDRSEGGLLFDDEHELKTHLARLVAEPDLRETLGRSARQTFKEVWSEEVGMNNYLDLIFELLESRRGRSTSRSQATPFQNRALMQTGTQS